VIKLTKLTSAKEIYDNVQKFGNLYELAYVNALRNLLTIILGKGQRSDRHSRAFFEVNFGLLFLDSAAWHWWPELGRWGGGAETVLGEHETANSQKAASIVMHVFSLKLIFSRSIRKSNFTNGSAGIFKQSMGARNRIGIGLSYRQIT
jgi:hypothetical protein